MLKVMTKVLYTASVWRVLEKRISTSAVPATFCAWLEVLFALYSSDTRCQDPATDGRPKQLFRIINFPFHKQLLFHRCGKHLSVICLAVVFAVFRFSRISPWRLVYIYINISKELSSSIFRVVQDYPEGGGKLQLHGKRYPNSPTTQQDVLLQKTWILISACSLNTTFIYVFVPIYVASYSRRQEPQISHSYCCLLQFF